MVNLCNTGAVSYLTCYPKLTLFDAEIKSEIMLLLGCEGVCVQVCIPRHN